MVDDDPHADRHSQAAAADLISDPDLKAQQEARNGLQQFSVVTGYIDDYTQGDKVFKLRLSMLLGLQRAALEGISAYVGNFRPSTVEIKGSQHAPVPAFRVPELVEDMCDYVNGNWEKPAIHLAAYVLWRINWIHPFTDGNGRTARAASYMVLCIRLGYRLPGIRTIPEQIADDKKPYYQALEQADAAEKQGRIDVSALEGLLEKCLAAQLLQVHEAATGRKLSGSSQ